MKRISRRKMLSDVLKSPRKENEERNKKINQNLLTQIPLINMKNIKKNNKNDNINKNTNTTISRYSSNDSGFNHNNS